MARKKARNGRSKKFWIILLVLVVGFAVDFGLNGTNGIFVQSVKTYLNEEFGLFEEEETANVVIHQANNEDAKEETQQLEKVDIELSNPKLAEYTDSHLDVYFFDVGQADSILLLLDGNALLVDVGNAGDAALDFKVKDKINLTYELSKFEFEKLDIVGTHNHEDHIGAMYKILKMFDVNNLYIPALLPKEDQARYYERMVEAIMEKDIHIVSPTTLTEEELIEEIEAYNKEIKQDANSEAELVEYNSEDYVRIGDTIPFGNAIVTVLAPNSEEYSDTNDYSIVLMVEFEGVKLLLTGDAGEESEKEILQYAEETGFNLDCDILKVGHHGSRTANTEEFISTIRPEYSVIMVEEGNSYGLPDEDVLERLERYNSVIYQTKDCGDIHLVINDGEYHFNFDYSHEVK